MYIQNTCIVQINTFKNFYEIMLLIILYQVIKYLRVVGNCDLCGSITGTL